MSQVAEGVEAAFSHVCLDKPTLEIPRPPFTPRPRNNHHNAAPAMPAPPVPLDHAPRAVLASSPGNVVDSCRNVSSPRPEDNDASEIPNSLGFTSAESAMI